MGMFSEIFGFFEAFCEGLERTFSPYPKKRKPRLWHDDKPIQRSRESYEPWDFMPPEYWQEQVRQQLKEKEELDKKIIEDYEARHRSEASGEEPEDSAGDKESNEDVSTEEQTVNSENTESGEAGNEPIGSYENSVSEPDFDGSSAFEGDSEGDSGGDFEGDSGGNSDASDFDSDFDSGN